ncbi:hypothetical protein CGCA056_v005915 [Colletotrichum aenigma]|uniref:uncharacterized protein n=1 Tax=Colletotrichum aenigma TaxID=1215731 RepID=UPI001872C8A4|nr:uncharacterized protein CGCA056_v005915 [Colletotrichum aenigma]KAF5522673.1 hypothetical protein CGCA056_v005915 [Colletotrichum aenigma]
MPPRILPEDHHIRIDVLICGLRLDKLRIRDIPRPSCGRAFVHVRLIVQVQKFARARRGRTCRVYRSIGSQGRIIMAEDVFACM